LPRHVLRSGPDHPVSADPQDDGDPNDGPFPSTRKGATDGPYARVRVTVKA
jgi:hypothetical protein